MFIIQLAHFLAQLAELIVQPFRSCRVLTRLAHSPACPDPLMTSDHKSEAVSWISMTQFTGFIGHLACIAVLSAERHCAWAACW